MLGVRPLLRLLRRALVTAAPCRVSSLAAPRRPAHTAPHNTHTHTAPLLSRRVFFVDSDFFPFLRGTATSPLSTLLCLSTRVLQITHDRPICRVKTRRVEFLERERERERERDRVAQTRRRINLVRER